MYTTSRLPFVGPRVFGHVQVLFVRAFHGETRNGQVVIGNGKRPNRPEWFVRKQRVSAVQFLASPVCDKTRGCHKYL